MEKIINNKNGTYTVKFDNWSLTLPSKEMELVFNECFNKSILKQLKDSEEKGK